MSATAGVPAAAAVSTAAAAMLGECAGRKKNGTQQAADQNGELVDGRTTLHNFTALAKTQELTVIEVR
jgi:X-X-X-Leu-X-X-Gly heptad repeat protein